MKHEIEVREDGPVEGAKNAIISVAIIVGIIAIIVGIAVAVYKYRHQIISMTLMNSMMILMMISSMTM